ncbi:short-chain dehydrogenase [Saccharata proteae CBS 121410]|uniref:Short-chain dehydrogenase n=1 Tax=Saccharata proteae CBS 121410 TaxID=1314787 RepID=A0A9P4HN03_9PEZI|nr:short-chain dehydrogenase [Saccharata proteae CBS 121410]
MSSRKPTAEDLASDLSSNIQGNTVLTTGVSPGSLGAYFVQTIAAHRPKLVILAGRNVSKLEQTAKEISTKSPDVETRTLQLDLSSPAQIRQAAAEVIKYEESIDVLVNNAGIMAVPTYQIASETGIELQFACNHIGHFLFTNLIMDKILSSKHPRIVNVSSDGHRLSDVRFDDLNFQGGKVYDKWRAYGQAKTANMLFTLSLAEKLGDKGLLSYSLHPGVIRTNLAEGLGDADFGELMALDVVQGAYQAKPGYWDSAYVPISEGKATHMAAAFGDGMEDMNGRYLSEAKISPLDLVKSWARDSFDAERLWKMSEDIVGQKFKF